MATSTMLYLTFILLTSLGCSFFLGYQTGYLRYVSMYEETIEELIQMTKREIANGTEALRTQNKNKDIN